jgi:hypothetical protein
MKRLGLRPALATAAALLVGVTTSAPAEAYVRSTTKILTPTAWNDPNIPLLLYVGDPPDFINRATVIQAIHAAAAAWSKPAVACTDLVLNVTETEEAVAAAAIDNVNRIGFRRDEWKKQPCDATKDMCAPYASAAIAITTVTSNTRTGQILDADMEINAVNKKFVDILTDTTPHLGMDLHDLQNTVTHELGHLIGLDHTCWNSLPPDMKPIPTDNMGIPSPSCADNISQTIRNATMFAQAVPRETEKRSLEVDDLLAVCDIYPVGYQGVHTSNDDAKGGCAMSADPGGSGPRGGMEAGLMTMGLAFVLRLRGRRRRG